MLSPAGRRKEQWQARTCEGEVGASCLEFRAQTALSAEQAASEAGSENKPGLPIQSLLGSQGRFLLSLPLYVSQSLILGLAGGVGPLGAEAIGPRGPEPPAVRCQEGDEAPAGLSA